MLTLAAMAWGAYRSQRKQDHYERLAAELPEAIAKAVLRAIRDGKPDPFPASHRDAGSPRASAYQRLAAELPEAIAKAVLRAIRDGKPDPFPASHRDAGSPRASAKVCAANREHA